MERPFTRYPVLSDVSACSDNQMAHKPMVSAWPSLPNATGSHYAASASRRIEPDELT